MTLSSVLLLPIAMLAVSAASQSPAEPTQAGTQKSQMSVGFTPPEKQGASRYGYGSSEEYRRAWQNRNGQHALPRCEQDRLLTDKSPCGNTPSGASAPRR